ncbi:hypothetical protein ABZ621_36690 [Streptomyces sp. NPDC007863]|uniref:hypothetical protein n=1 Tax=Streptomyces sp. NPDC007863 TaxID=3154894 RepID=UPI0033CBE730
MTDADVRDIAAMRQQGSLGDYLRHTREQEAIANAQRKRLVYRHTDLVDQLKLIGQDPWNGRIPPAQWGGAINTSPIRAALLAIVDEAEQRSAAGTQAVA